MTETSVLAEFLYKIGFDVDDNGAKKFKAVEDGMRSLAAAGAAAAKSIDAAVKNIAQQFEELYYVGQRTGSTVQALQQIGYAADQTAQSAKGIQSAIEAVGMAVRLNPALEGYARSIGVQVQRSKDGVVDFAKLLDDLAEKTKDEPFWLQARRLQPFGISPEMLQQYRQNIGEFHRLQAEAAEHQKLFGIDPEQLAQQSKDYEQSTRKLQLDVTLAWERISTKLLPIATRVVDVIDEIVVAFGKFDKETNGLGSWAVAGVSSLGALAGSLSILYSAFKSVQGLFALASFAKTVQELGKVTAATDAAVAAETGLGTAATGAAATTATAGAGILRTVGLVAMRLAGWVGAILAIGQASNYIYNKYTVPELDKHMDDAARKGERFLHTWGPLNWAARTLTGIDLNADAARRNAALEKRAAELGGPTGKIGDAFEQPDPDAGKTDSEKLLEKLAKGTEPGQDKSPDQSTATLDSLRASLTSQGGDHAALLADPAAMGILKDQLNETIRIRDTVRRIAEWMDPTVRGWVGESATQALAQPASPHAAPAAPGGHPSSRRAPVGPRHAQPRPEHHAAPAAPGGHPPSRRAPAEPRHAQPRSEHPATLWDRFRSWLGVAPHREAPAEPADGNMALGSLSRGFESNGDAGRVGGLSTDGHAYGLYQIATKPGTMAEFLKYLGKVDPASAKFLEDAGGERGAANATGEFTRAWKQLAQDPKFGQQQHEFIRSTHYGPLMERLRNAGLDLSNRSKTLQDVMWSTANGHGVSGGFDVVRNAVASLGGNLAGISDEDLIKAIYAERGKHYGKSTPEERKSVQERYVREAQLALRHLTAERAAPPPRQPPAPQPPAPQPPAPQPTAPQPPAADPAAPPRPPEALHGLGTLGDLALRGVGALFNAAPMVPPWVVNHAMTNEGARNVTIQQSTRITVSGSGDPQAAASATAAAQNNVNDRLVRNLQSSAA